MNIILYIAVNLSLFVEKLNFERGEAEKRDKKK
jgi:hypothetical protein